MISVQGDLFVDVATLPWYGRSPRGLTRGAIALFSRREPQKPERFFVDPGQYDLFPAATIKAPWKYQGAPLLLELEEEDDV